MPPVGKVDKRNTWSSPVQKSVMRFIANLRATCKETGVRLRLAPTRHVRLGPGILSNGFFYGGSPELAVAIKKPQQQWLPVLVHESSHLDQWREKSPAWISGVHAYTGLFEALADTNPINRSYIPDWARMARDIELDCEMRSLAKIVEHNLPIDPMRYVRTANAYIWFYTMIPEINSWYIPGKEPYHDKKILALCPEHFMDDYDNIPPELRREYLRLMQK